MQSKEKKNIVSLVSYKHSMLTKVIACLLIFTFTITNLTYGYERSDFQHLREMRDAEDRASTRVIQKKMAEQAPDQKIEASEELRGKRDRGIVWWFAASAALGLSMFALFTFVPLGKILNWALVRTWLIVEDPTLEKLTWYLVSAAVIIPVITGYVIWKRFRQGRFEKIVRRLQQKLVESGFVIKDERQKELIRIEATFCLVCRSIDITLRIALILLFGAFQSEALMTAAMLVWIFMGGLVRGVALHIMQDRLQHVPLRALSILCSMPLIGCWGAVFLMAPSLNVFLRWIINVSLIWPLKRIIRKISSLQKRIPPFKSTVKPILGRGAEIAAAGAFISVLAVPMLAIAAIIKINDPSLPVLYEDPERVGLYGKTFTMYKFRTMKPSEDKSNVSSPDDERVTKFSWFLRRTALDELPPFFNILKGDMSLVGRMPPPQHEIEEALSPEEFLRYVREDCTEKSGIFGPAQLATPRSPHGPDWINRIRIESDYRPHRTFCSDIKIVFQTIIKLIKAAFPAKTAEKPPILENREEDLFIALGIRKEMWGTARQIMHLRRELIRLIEESKRDGKPKFVCVTGDAGAGKSRLCEILKETKLGGIGNFRHVDLEKDMYGFSGAQSLDYLDSAEDNIVLIDHVDAHEYVPSEDISLIIQVKASDASRKVSILGRGDSLALLEIHTTVPNPDIVIDLTISKRLIGWRIAELLRGPKDDPQRHTLAKLLLIGLTLPLMAAAYGANWWLGPIAGLLFAVFAFAHSSSGKPKRLGPNQVSADLWLWDQYARDVGKRRYGLDNTPTATLEAIGEDLGIKKGGAWKIKSKALARLLEMFIKRGIIPFDGITAAGKALLIAAVVGAGYLIWGWMGVVAASFIGLFALTQYNAYYEDYQVYLEFLQKARKTPFLSEEDERMLLVEAQCGVTKEARTKACDRLIKSNLLFIIGIARPIKRRHPRRTWEELIGAGLEGFYHTIHMFNLESPNTLRTYAHSWVKAYIERYIERSIKYEEDRPHWIQDMLGQVALLEQRTGRRLGIEDVREAFPTLPDNRAERLIRHFYSEQRRRIIIPRSMEDLLGMIRLRRRSPPPTPLQYAMAIELSSLLSELLKVFLNERERKVLIYRFWRDMKDTEISQEIGITPEGVRKVALRALRKLRRALETKKGVKVVDAIKSIIADMLGNNEGQADAWKAPGGERPHLAWKYIWPGLVLGTPITAVILFIMMGWAGVLAAPLVSIATFVPGWIIHKLGHFTGKCIDRFYGEPNTREMIAGPIASCILFGASSFLGFAFAIRYPALSIFGIPLLPIAASATINYFFHMFADGEIALANPFAKRPPFDKHEFMGVLLESKAQLAEEFARTEQLIRLNIEGKWHYPIHKLVERAKAIITSKRDDISMYVKLISTKREGLGITLAYKISMYEPSVGRHAFVLKLHKSFATGAIRIVVDDGKTVLQKIIGGGAYSFPEVPLKTVSDVLVECLEKEGVRHVFGVPGSEILHLIDSIRRSGKIKFIQTTTERGAAIMADVYGRLRREPGVCLTTLGPGATDAFTGVTDAYLDEVSLVIVTGQTPTTAPEIREHQRVNLGDIFAPVTKLTREIEKDREAYVKYLVGMAFENARTLRRGPSCIILPSDIADKKVRSEAPLRLKRQLSFPFPKLDKASVEEIAAAIKDAKCPVIIAGNGLLRADRGESSKALTEFVERHGIPTTMTFMGKGSVSAESSWSLPPINAESDISAQFLRSQADLIITVGYDTVECASSVWNPDGDKKIVNIDFVPATTIDTFRPTRELIGDVKGGLAALSKALGDYRTPRELEGEVARIKEVHSLALSQICADAKLPKANPIGVIRELREVLDTLDREGIMICDVGLHKMLVGQHYPVYSPTTAVFFNGLAPMGGALPGAIGAKLAYPDRKVIVICGDGGFKVCANELETASREKLPIVVVVMEDRAWGLIKKQQQELFGAKGRYGTEFGDYVDLVKVTQGYGAQACRVKKPGGLKDVLGRAFRNAHKESKPYVVVVPVEYMNDEKIANPPPGGGLGSEGVGGLDGFTPADPGRRGAGGLTGAGPKGDEKTDWLKIPSINEEERGIVEHVFRAIGIPEKLDWQERERSFKVAELPLDRLNSYAILTAFGLPESTYLDGSLLIINHGNIPLFLCLRREDNPIEILDFSIYYAVDEDFAQSMEKKIRKIFPDLDTDDVVYLDYKYGYVYAVFDGQTGELIGIYMRPNKKMEGKKVIKIPIFPGVYYPLHVSSVISARAVAKLTRPGMKVLILGTGVGLEARIAAEKGAMVDAIDIKEMAVENTKLTCSTAGVEDRINAFVSDLFDNLDEDDLYDLIVFTMPHFKLSGKPLSADERTPQDWNTTDFNRELLDRIAFGISRHMAEGGRAVIVNRKYPDTIRRTLEEKTGLPITTDSFGVRGSSQAYIISKAKSTPQVDLALDGANGLGDFITRDPGGMAGTALSKNPGKGLTKEVIEKLVPAVIKEAGIIIDSLNHLLTPMQIREYREVLFTKPKSKIIYLRHLIRSRFKKILDGLVSDLICEEEERGKGLKPMNRRYRRHRGYLAGLRRKSEGEKIERGPYAEGYHDGQRKRRDFEPEALEELRSEKTIQLIAGKLVSSLEKKFTTPALSEFKTTGEAGGAGGAVEAGRGNSEGMQRWVADDLRDEGMDGPDGFDETEGEAEAESRDEGASGGVVPSGPSPSLALSLEEEPEILKRQLNLVSAYLEEIETREMTRRSAIGLLLLTSLGPKYLAKITQEEIDEARRFLALVGPVVEGDHASSFSVLAIMPPQAKRKLRKELKIAESNLRRLREAAEAGRSLSILQTDFTDQILDVFLSIYKKYLKMNEDQVPVLERYLEGAASRDEETQVQKWLDDFTRWCSFELPDREHGYGRFDESHQFFLKELEAFSPRARAQVLLAIRRKQIVDYRWVIEKLIQPHIETAGAIERIQARLAERAFRQAGRHATGKTTATTEISYEPNLPPLIEGRHYQIRVPEEHIGVARRWWEKEVKGIYGDSITGQIIPTNNGSFIDITCRRNGSADPTNGLSSNGQEVIGHCTVHVKLVRKQQDEVIPIDKLLQIFTMAFLASNIPDQYYNDQHNTNIGIADFEFLFDAVRRYHYLITGKELPKRYTGQFPSWIEKRIKDCIEIEIILEGIPPAQQKDIGEELKRSTEELRAV